MPQCLVADDTGYRVVEIPIHVRAVRYKIIKPDTEDKTEYVNPYKSRKQVGVTVPLSTVFSRQRILGKRRKKAACVGKKIKVIGL